MVSREANHTHWAGGFVSVVSGCDASGSLKGRGSFNLQPRWAERVWAEILLTKDSEMLLCWKLFNCNGEWPTKAFRATQSEWTLPCTQLFRPDPIPCYDLEAETTSYNAPILGTDLLCNFFHVLLVLKYLLRYGGLHICGMVSISGGRD